MSSPCVGIDVGIEVRSGGENATTPSHTMSARLMGRRVQ